MMYKSHSLSVSLWSFLTLVMTLTTSVSDCTDLFTGIDGLKSLSVAENALLPEFDKVIDSLQDKIALLKMMLADLKHTHSNPSTEEVALAGHPVHAYNLIKRWRHLQNIFSNEPAGQENQINNIVDPSCSNEHSNCTIWARMGECEKNPAYMLQGCRLACKVCVLPPLYIHDQQLYKLNTALSERTGSPPPNEEDFTGAGQGLVRLQRTYEIETEDLIVGDIRGHKSASSLQADDCLKLGQSAVEMGEWSLALQWLKKAKFNSKSETNRAQVRYLMAVAYIGIKDYITANETLMDSLGGKIPDIDDSSCVDRHEFCVKWARENECQNNPEYMLRQCQFSCQICQDLRPQSFPLEYELTNTYFTLLNELANETNTQWTGDFNELLRMEAPEWKPVYEELCRGQGQNIYSTSVCRYRSALLPWNVYKEEILMMNPRISMVYDVINDAEAQMFIQKAASLMSRGLVGTDRRVTDDRVSKVGWLHDTDPDILRIAERVEMITGLEGTERHRTSSGLEIISSDSFQVVNYGIGGHYEPHTDYFQDDLEELAKTTVGELVRSSGDRIATFLFYLTHVEGGGGTVFPEVKIQVPPIKNAAAFWFNSKLSGEYDPLTLHAGCPVLLGEKWVSNKWIREFGNQFTRKCGLTENAKYS